MTWLDNCSRSRVYNLDMSNLHNMETVVILSFACVSSSESTLDVLPKNVPDVHGTLFAERRSHPVCCSRPLCVALGSSSRRSLSSWRLRLYLIEEEVQRPRSGPGK